MRKYTPDVTAAFFRVIRYGQEPEENIGIGGIEAIYVPGAPPQRFNMPKNRRVVNPKYKDSMLKRFQNQFKLATTGVEPTLKPQSAARMRKFRMPKFRFGGKK